MLAIARALVRDPKIILLDEPFEGLAPVIVRDLMEACRKLAAGRADHRAGRAESRRDVGARPAAPTSSTTATSCTKGRPPRSRPTRKCCTAISACERAASHDHGNRVAIADDRVALEPKNECVRNGRDDLSEA